MTTLLISGVIAFGLGLILFAAVGIVLFLQPQRKPAPRPQTPPQQTAQSAPDGGDGAISDLAPVSLGEDAPTPPVIAPEEDSLAHINTGVMNLRDFENFEELIAAAESLNQGQKEE